jgi:hypothetical protein
MSILQHAKEEERTADSSGPAVQDAITNQYSCTQLNPRNMTGIQHIDSIVHEVQPYCSLRLAIPLFWPFGQRYTPTKDFMSAIFFL